MGWKMRGGEMNVGHHGVCCCSGEGGGGRVGVTNLLGVVLLFIRTKPEKAH